MAPPVRRRRDPRSAGWWEDVLASFTDAVILTDAAGHVVFCNHAAEELTGLPRSRLLHDSGASLHAALPTARAMVRHVLRAGQNTTRGEEQLARPRQRSVPVRVSCLAIRRAGGPIRGAALVMQDLRQQKVLEEAAHRNESLARLGSVVAGLAHEVRNPLAGIRGAAQLLAQRLSDHDPARDYTDVITREADRLSALVEDLLALGTAPAPVRVRLNIHLVIRRVLALLEPELTGGADGVVCEFDPSLPDVCGDESQLSQVLLNVLRNAMNAMATATPVSQCASPIVVRTRMVTDFRIRRGDERAAHFLRIEVADSGSGIAPEDVPRIFEPFFSKSPGGTGLGLAISQRIVTDHGGGIQACANQPRGTVVTITLPIAK